VGGMLDIPDMTSD